MSSVLQVLRLQTQEGSACAHFICFAETCYLQLKILNLLHHFMKMHKPSPFVGILIHSDLHHMLMTIRESKVVLIRHKRIYNF
jgi:hypothetical protein